VSKDKEYPINDKLKIIGLMLALAVVDEKSSKMWLEFSKAMGKTLDETLQRIAFHYGETFLDTAHNMDKFLHLVVDISEEEISKSKKKGVKKNARR